MENKIKGFRNFEVRHPQATQAYRIVRYYIPNLTLRQAKSFVRKEVFKNDGKDFANQFNITLYE
jgi:hypothetical protein